jgi:hypothetical protein
MRERLTFSILAACAATASAQGIQRQPLNLPFDAAYMVAAPGDTTPLTSFSWGGAPPTLLLDMPAGTSWDYWFSSVGSTWRSPSGATLSVEYYTQADQDKLWFSPPAATWSASQAVGNWSISAVHTQVELVMIYGVGAPIVWGRGSATVPFTVTAPLPGDFNQNGAIEHADYEVWRGAYGATSQGDANGDSTSDAADYTTWRDQMGSGPSSQAAAVPEPGTALLALTAMTMVAAGRRVGARRSARTVLA